MLVLHFVGSWDSVGGSRLRGWDGHYPQTGHGPTPLPIRCRLVLRGEPLQTSGLSPLWDSPCECSCSDLPKLPTPGSGGRWGHTWALPGWWHENSKPQSGVSWGSPAPPPPQGSPSSAAWTRPGFRSLLFQAEGSGKVFDRVPALGTPPVCLPRLRHPAAGPAPGARRAPRGCGPRLVRSRVSPVPSRDTPETRGLANSFLQHPGVDDIACVCLMNTR